MGSIDSAYSGSGWLIKAKQRNGSVPQIAVMTVLVEFLISCG